MPRNMIDVDGASYFLPPLPSSSCRAYASVCGKPVQHGGAAAKAQVQPKDIVNSINGNPCPLYEGLIETIGAVGRPVVLGFFRPGNDSGKGGGGRGQGAVGQPAGGQGAWSFQRPKDAEKQKKVE